LAAPALCQRRARAGPRTLVAKLLRTVSVLPRTSSGAGASARLYRLHQNTDRPHLTPARLSARQHRRPRECHRRHRLRLRAKPVRPPRPSLDHVGEARFAGRRRAHRHADAVGPAVRGVRFRRARLALSGAHAFFGQALPGLPRLRRRHAVRYRDRPGADQADLGDVRANHLARDSVAVWLICCCGPGAGKQDQGRQNDISQSRVSPRNWLTIMSESALRSTRRTAVERQRAPKTCRQSACRPPRTERFSAAAARRGTGSPARPSRPAPWSTR
jgi:hypothetical protein